MIRYLLLVVAVFVAGGNGARILAFFCQSARSHHLVFQPVLLELARRGHHVDYYTHVLIKDAPETLNQIVLGSSEEAMMHRDSQSFDYRAVKKIPMATTSLFLRIFKFKEFACHADEPFKKLLESNASYDMVIGEFFFAQEDYVVLLDKFKPAVGVAISCVPDNLWVNEMSGLPDNPSYMINFMSEFSDRLSFWERVNNALQTSLMKLIDYYFVRWSYQSLVDEHMRYDGWEGRPSLWDLSRDMALILTNSHHSLGYAYPKAPHVKEILGMNVDSNPPPLPQDLQEFMDNAEHGVVYFSMGTILGISQLKKIGAYDAFVNVFSNLKQKVLWKWTDWSNVEMPNLPNIKLVKWLPQQSVLAHNKTKLFVTHGGLGGMTEAINNGVPMVGMAFFADQFKNVKLMTSAGFGEAIDFSNFTEKSVHEAIHKVLDNPKYKEEAMRRSTLFKDRPMKPVQEAVYWIEYVLKHGKVLQPASVKLPIYQIYLLDVILLLSCILLISLLVTSKLITLLKTHKKKKETENKKKNQ